MKNFKSKICIGITNDMELVFIEIETERGYFSITHKTYGELLTETEGEQRGREYLEDGELWKQAVEAGNTTAGLDDWIETVLNIDGWENLLDINYFGVYNDESYYIAWNSCGADAIGALNKEYKKSFITEKLKQLLIKSDKLHLKDFKKYTKKDKQLLDKIFSITAYKNDNLENVTNLIPIMLGED